jgi:hypothetical protein
MGKYLKGFRLQIFRYPDKFKNLISDKVKSQTAAGNRCFYSLRQIFSIKTMS